MKLPLTAGRCVVGPQPGFGADPQQPSTSLTKHNGNLRRNMVDRRTIADPEWFSRFLGKKVGGMGGGISYAVPPPSLTPIDADA